MPIARDLLGRLREVLAAPTAPFAEGAVHARIHAAVKASPRLREELDEFGNHLVIYGPGRPAVLFACHTDHPALRSEGDGTASIRGGIRIEALTGARVRDREGARGRVIGPARGRAKGRVRIEMEGAPPRGEPLLLDLPDMRIARGKIHSRAIDDLCAVAACLTLFDRLARLRHGGCVGALFTRAEEVGFAGALGWVRKTKVPRRTVIVNLEMSSARPHTPQGAGPILRVGDRITTFTPRVTSALEDVARTLQEREKDFVWQRALMDGGACEATVYAHAGFPTGALCLPLLNYHNHAPGKGAGGKGVAGKGVAGKGIAMEYVDANDANNLVRWMVAIARTPPARASSQRVGGRLDELWRINQRELRATARRR